MAVIVTNAIKSTYGRLTYIFAGTPHSTKRTNNRVLACSGTNINLLHNPDGTIDNNQNGFYLERQFKRSLKKAYNPQRTYQAQSIIISFNRDEFDTNNLKLDSSQALRLVQGYVRRYFADAQSVSAIQCDADSDKPMLHCHLLINSVKRNGKTVATSRFTVSKLRKDFNQYMEQNFQRVTGRDWVNPFDEPSERKDVKDLPTRADWERELKELIDSIKKQVSNATQFLSRLSQHGVIVTDRKHGQSWTYHTTIKGRKGPRKVSARDFYQRTDKKAGRVLRTRGLGKNYTKEALEKYWQKQAKIQAETQPDPTPLHIKQEKKDDTYGKQSDDERRQREKIKNLAAQAQISIKHQRYVNQLNTRRLRTAKAEEKRWQRRHQRQTGQTGQNNGLKGRHETVSDQERHRRRQRQLIQEKRRAKRQSNSKDDGPEL